MTFCPSSLISPDSGSTRRRIDRPAVDLPQPELAHEAQRLAHLDVEGHILDRVDVRHGAAQEAALHREAGDEVPDRQQDLRLGRVNRPGIVGRGRAQKLHRLGRGPAAHLAKLRHRRQKRLRIGVLRAFEDVLDRALLDLAAAVHHDDAVGHLRHHRHVVGDEHHRRPGLALQPVDERQDLGLDRHVERGRGLVGDQHLRLAGERHRDHHALAHAPRQLVRILRHAPLGLGDADLAQKLERPRLGLGPFHALVDAQAFGQLPPHREHRVERGHRLLEDHADLVAADRAHDLGAGLGHVDDVALPRSNRSLPPAIRPPPNSTSRMRLSDDTDLPEPDLADDADGFAGADLEAHVLDADDGAVLRLELDPKTVEPCDRLVEHDCPRCLIPRRTLGPKRRACQTGAPAVACKCVQRSGASRHDLAATLAICTRFVRN